MDMQVKNSDCKPNRHQKRARWSRERRGVRIALKDVALMVNQGVYEDS